MLGRLDAMRTPRTVSGPIQGDLLAGDLTLPAQVELSGDTTIIADRVLLSGHGLRVVAHGHALRIFPVTAITPGAQTASTGSGALPMALAAITPVIFDTSGEAGKDALGKGSDGTDGTSGIDGEDGAPG